MTRPFVAVCFDYERGVRVRMFTPWVIKNHSHEMKPDNQSKQVLLLFSFFIWHLILILLMDGALVMKHVVSYC